MDTYTITHKPHNNTADILIRVGWRHGLMGCCLAAFTSEGLEEEAGRIALYSKYTVNSCPTWYYWGTPQSTPSSWAHGTVALRPPMSYSGMILINLKRTATLSSSTTGLKYTRWLKQNLHMGQQEIYHTCQLQYVNYFVFFLCWCLDYIVNFVPLIKPTTVWHFFIGSSQLVI